MQKLLFPLLFLTAINTVSAQQGNGQSFEDIQRRLMEMQKQLMQDLQKGGMGGSFFSFPGSDSSYTFRFDTTIVGDNFSGSFHFGPFGSDSTMRDPFFGSELFNQFFGNSLGDTWGQREPEDAPVETEPEGEHLLPEERLRLEEEQEKTGKSKPGKTAPSERKQEAKPKIKTIRI